MFWEMLEILADYSTNYVNPLFDPYGMGKHTNNPIVPLREDEKLKLRERKVFC